VCYFFFEVFLAAFLAAGFLAAFFLAIIIYLLLHLLRTREFPVWRGSMSWRDVMNDLSCTYLLCNLTGCAADPHE
jgi:hypothetical protein